MKAKFPLIVSLITAFCGVAVAQSSSDYEVPRTEFNQPDLQGVWNFSSNTPMQRPEEYGEQEFLSEQQIQEAIAEDERRAAAADARAAVLVLNPEAPEVSEVLDRAPRRRQRQR